MNTSLSALRQFDIGISCSGLILNGNVVTPAEAKGLVIFAHGSGSSRLSPRNRLVAGQMHRKGLATLLFDLLTPEEARASALRFNIPLLTRRLAAATRWAQQQTELKKMSIGYFGASTGAAAAIAAASAIPEIKAIVTRGGRADLAVDAASRIKSPTLLIVGDLDYPVVDWNREVFSRLSCTKDLSLIQGASHLFQEPGTLEQVAQQAAEWFETHLLNVNEGRN
jgi:putative phosphoribosyl transferase